MKGRSTILLAMVVVLCSIIVLPAVGVQVSPQDFGPNAKIEDFEGLANVVLKDVVNPSNPHYIVSNAYWFNGDFSLTQPAPNPPAPGDPFLMGTVVIGDFTQGTVFWGLSHRVIEGPADVYSGSAYLGMATSPVERRTAIFTFNSPMVRVGTWLDGADYDERPVELAVLDVDGFEIESVSAMPGYWTFLAIESQTPIWAFSITGYVPVIDDVMYEVPEPATLLLLGFCAAFLKRRR